MIIDVHVHPLLYSCINPDAASFKERCDEMNCHLRKPATVEAVLERYDFYNVRKIVLLAEDCSASYGKAILSNEDIRTVVDHAPDRFIGFASVDPRSPDAPEKLEHAFLKLGLQGLKLNTAKLRVYPADGRMRPLYDLCLRYNKPVIFHAGSSWQEKSLSKYARPSEFEEVAVDYPELRMSLAHFGWPWVQETVMLLTKYPNVYTDLSAGYLDSPAQFMQFLFTQECGRYWAEHNFFDKVMFGTNTPRFGVKRMLRAVGSLEISEELRARILGGNAVKFLGLEE